MLIFKDIQYRLIGKGINKGYIIYNNHCVF